MKFRNVIRYIPLIIAVICVIYFYLYNYVFSNKQHFTENELNTKIMRIENYMDKSLQFYYSNDYCITTTHTKGDVLIVGDSISKKAHSNSFCVFRKNNGVYYLFGCYSID